MNKALEWFKAHPTETLLGAGAIGGLFFLMTRSSGSSSSGSGLASYYNAQLQMANLNNQNAAVQAQYQAQSNAAALQAQQQNNALAAQLALTAQQNQVGIQTAQLAANVQNNQTAAQESVYNNTINAQVAAQQNQLAFEQAIMKQQGQNVAALAPYVTSFGGSQNRLAFLQSLMGQPGAAAATQQSYAQVTGYQSAVPIGIVNSIGNAAGGTLVGLFG